MVVAIETVVAHEDPMADLVAEYGTAASVALLDRRNSLFAIPQIHGVIGYRAGWGCAVAIGDPVCDDADRAVLAQSFRSFCHARGWHTVYVIASQQFTDWAVAQGYAAVEFGEELII